MILKPTRASTGMPAAQVGLRSMIVVPLRFQASSVGVLKAMSAQPDRFSEDDTALLGLLSELVAAAMYFATRLDHSDLYYQATHDSLTGLANRALFMDRLRHDLSRSARDGRCVGVLIIDMDALKAINDNHGHRAGDAVIREFSNRCMSVARVSDTVARLGGDEFGVILSPIDSTYGAGIAAERIQSALLVPCAFEERTFQLRASIGAALFPDDSDDLDKLVELADQRMYAMKRERRRIDDPNEHGTGIEQIPGVSTERSIG